ncbi:UNVERIFIED_CONTAM: superfamily II DNA or RNA helicase [Paenibacillus sp. PvR008]
MTTHQDIELYPHNQETYDKIIEAWRTHNRVATVQATGTGKTFLILKCLFTYPDVNKVVLAPSNHILNQLESKVDELPNTILLTYSKLSFMSEEEIKQLDASMVVFDEFHRCGADKWGRGVGKFTELFPNAKILGTSATPIRFLDGERDMSDELFDRNVVTNLSLPQAIVKGILPMPKYISALYTFDDEILNLNDKIDKSNNSDDEKEDVRKEVELMKKELNKSKGIPVILKKHLGKTSGKFIVFCRNKEHLYEMKDTVTKWFIKGRINSKVNTHIVYSTKTDNKDAIKQFTFTESNDSIQLLFTIDMLNEGLHIDDVDGVVFLRSTISPTIYYQQLGRAVKSGGKEPYVFDFVNNFNNLKANNFAAELKDAIEKEVSFRSSGGKYEMDISDFVIYDEMQDVHNLFSKIEDRLKDNWDEMFERYCDGEMSDSIKNWLSYQKYLYNKNLLRRERVTKLNNVGFVWNVKEKIWFENFSLLMRYIETYGHSNVTRYEMFEGKKLGQWVADQRKSYSNKELSQKRIERLNSIELCWKPFVESWRRGMECIVQFKEKYRHCNVPRNYEINGVKLGVWVTTQRKSYIKGLLSKEKIMELELIGFEWEPYVDIWNYNYNLLREFKEKHGHCNIPAGKIKIWINNQRQAYKRGQLLQERIDQLNNIGFVWDPTKELWETNFDLVRKYANQHGHCNIPVNYVTDSGVNLGMWLSRQRCFYKKSKLSEDYINLLESIGIKWRTGKVDTIEKIS